MKKGKVIKMEEKKKKLSVEATILLTVFFTLLVIVAIGVTCIINNIYDEQQEQLKVAEKTKNTVQVQQNKEDKNTTNELNSTNAVKNDNLNSQQEKISNTSEELDYLDNTKVEDIIKNKIIEIAKHDFAEYPINENQKIAEAHTVFGKDINNNIAYYTVLTNYGVYEKDDYQLVSGTSMPLLIGINSNYEFVEYKMPEEGSRYTQSVKDIFPDDIENMILNNELEVENEKQQIEKYFE